MLKKINESALGAGKIATIRCGEEICRDGNNDEDESQTIIVGAAESLSSEHIIAILKRIVDEVVKGDTLNITVQFPSELEILGARKMVEIALHATNQLRRAS